MLYMLTWDEGLLGGKEHTAQFYLGYCEPERVLERLEAHITGRGAKITRAVMDRGGYLQLVCTWEGDRSEERRFKKWNNHRKVIQHVYNRRIGRFHHMPDFLT